MEMYSWKAQAELEKKRQQKAQKEMKQSFGKLYTIWPGLSRKKISQRQGFQNITLYTFLPSAANRKKLKCEAFVDLRYKPIL